MEPTSVDRQAADGLAAILGIPFTEAQEWYKAYDRSSEKAANAYFDNGGVLKVPNPSSSWDEDAFHSDRASGGSQRPPSFAVHAQDTLNPQVFSDNAPSRPPSRVSMHGPHGHNGFGQQNIKPRPQMSLAEKEDFDIQQAMSQSMTESQIASQENGVITGKNLHFGPATREHYDTQQWTMTLPKTFAQETLGNPDPPDRKREHDSPVFFKPSLSGHRLPALIKILHSIPIGREALLNQNHLLADYGYDEEWWDGVPIDARKLNVVDRVEQGTSIISDEIVHESQRLVAFLEETERAYGSVDALAQLSIFKGFPDESAAGRFLEAWTAATVNRLGDNPLASTFKIASITMDNQDREVEHHLHHFFEIFVPEPESELARTLYDILDGQFWGDFLENNADYHCLREVGDILCIQLSSQKERVLGTGVKIPSNLYLDRYFASSKDQVKQMLAQKWTAKEKIKGIDEARDRITNYKSPADEQTLDAPSLVEQILGHFENVGARRGGPGSTDNQQTVDQLKALAESISTKLALLQKSRDLAMENLKEISKWYTIASEDPAQPPWHKYTLRGVSPSVDTLYVLEGESSEDLRPEAWHWWMLSYSRSEAKPILRKRVREVEVLKAAKDESRTVLLVYASEKALSVAHTCLPSQLRNFVQLDNLNFNAELDKCQSPKPPAPTNGTVRHDNEDLVTNFYHSSDDGVEPIDIPLDDPSERSPLLRKSGSESPQHSTEGNLRSDSPSQTHEKTATEEVQECETGAIEHAFANQGFDMEMEDRPA